MTETKQPKDEAPVVNVKIDKPTTILGILGAIVFWPLFIVFWLVMIPTVLVCLIALLVVGLALAIPAALIVIIVIRMVERWG